MAARPNRCRPGEDCQGIKGGGGEAAGEASTQYSVCRISIAGGRGGTGSNVGWATPSAKLPLREAGQPLPPLGDRVAKNTLRIRLNPGCDDALRSAPLRPRCRARDDRRVAQDAAIGAGRTDRQPAGARAIDARMPGAKSEFCGKPTVGALH
jgi:hypothetical protein